MKKTIWFYLSIVVLFSCNKDEELTILKPLDYLPAYPGSYWTYTNGERIKTNTEYVAHSYQLGVSSTEKSDEKLVPYYNGKALYEYSIEQYSTAYPLKKLFAETGTDAWVVDKINGEFVKRELVSVQDCVQIDTTWYYPVIVVVEFIDSLTSTRWNYKEYYAKDYGLIKSEINNPFDDLPAIVEKELMDSYINR